MWSTFPAVNKHCVLYNAIFIFLLLEIPQPPQSVTTKELFPKSEMAASRAFSAFLAVFLCGLLLSTFHLPEKKSVTSVNVVNSQQVESSTSVFTVEELVGLPFSRQLIAANAAFSDTEKTHIKRATPFEVAKEKGAQYFTAYQSAFECDRTPGPVFTEDQFKNAWKDEPLNGDFVDEDWQKALGIPARPPNYVATKHRQTVAPFVSATGQNVKVV